ncbi:MAG TPA: hypothetical protein VNH83_28310 [Bryobacteraceae bacterium]|nr:hypothetical protein [Bryobacteraceae bacterium]
MKSKKSKQYRQGDVLLTEVAVIPPQGKIGAMPIEGNPRDVANRVVLAYGEVTGHAHTLDAEDCELVEVPAGLGAELEGWFLRVHQDTQLTHQEHSTIEVPAGNYRVTRQREYSPEAIRNVAD